MASSDTTQAYGQLVQILSDESTLAAILATPKNALNSAQTEALITLARHFLSPSEREVAVSGDEAAMDEAEDDEPHSSADGEEPCEKPSRRVAKGPRNPWRAFMRLKVADLHVVVEEYIRCEASPKDFLNDTDLLTHRIAEFQTEDKMGDAVMACYKYTISLDSRHYLDHIRWLFSMLMFFDLFRLINPQGSGRVGHLMQRDFNKFLGPVLSTANMAEAVALKQLNEWSLRGSKLHKLCLELGPGCLFYLGDQLSRDFLATKFTAKGAYWESAMDHLKQLKVKEKAAESGADQLAGEIRSFLGRPFKQAYRRRRVDA